MKRRRRRIEQARRSGLVSGSGLEGRHGVSPEELQAALVDPHGDHKIGFLSAREQHLAIGGSVPPVTPQQATAYPDAGPKALLPGPPQLLLAEGGEAEHMARGGSAEFHAEINPYEIETVNEIEDSNT